MPYSWMTSRRGRSVCVMNEMGIIYHGAYDDIAERNWNYGQVVQRKIKNFKTDFRREKI